MVNQGRTKQPYLSWFQIVFVVVFLIILYETVFFQVNLLKTASVSPCNVSSISKQDTQFQRAKEESFGFFDDIPDEEWELLKERVKEVQPNICSYCRGRNAPHAWFQNHYEPEFACRFERRIGRLGDGGKWTCDPHRLKNRDCLVYSVGSNNDFSFEQAILSTIGDHCEIHTFDPANYSARAAEAGAHYHQWGIDGTAWRNRRGQVFKTLRQTAEELGHIGRKVDIFKIDCEGCELTSYSTWINETEVGVALQQVLVEVHGNKDAVRQPETSNFFTAMHQGGYVIFHKEPNIHYWKFGPAIEFALLKLSPSFFK